MDYLHAVKESKRNNIFLGEKKNSIVACAN